MRVKSFLILATLFLLVACTKKGGNVYLKGKIYNPVTNEGVPNLEIRLIKNQPFKGDSFNGGSSKVVKTATSDANGNFELCHTVSLIHEYRYQLVLDYDKYQEIGWESGVKRTFDKKVRKGKNDYDNLQVVQRASVQIHLENVNCLSVNDSARVIRTYLLTGETFPKWGVYYTLGCFDDTNTVLHPEGDYRYDWYVIRDGVRTDSSRIFQVRAGQPNLIELLY